MPWATDDEWDQLLARWRGALRGAAGPLRDRLAEAVHEAVTTGLLPVGSRLPSERRLAEALGVSRGTVVAAFGQLVDRGTLDRRAGSGSYVRSTPVTAASLVAPGDQVLVDFWLDRSTPIDLGISSPIEAPGPLFAELASIGEGLLGPNGQHGYSVNGEPVMRRAAARRLARCGLAVDDDAVLITSGAQQALQLAVRSLVKPGDRVFVEDPAYPGLLAILRQAHAVPVPLRTDAEGVLPAELVHAVGEHGPGVLATCSLVSNPGASLLSPRRRAALLEVIIELDVVVLENLTLAETLLDDVVAAAPLTADPRVRGVAVGSASKLIWGGLRVGWLHSSKPWLRRIAHTKALDDLGTSPITQRLTASLLDHLDEHPEWLLARREQLRDRRDLAVQLLHQHLPTWRVRSPVGGLSLWVRVPRVDTAHLIGAADRLGVRVMPGVRCTAGNAFGDRLRICFDRDPQVLREAVARLALAQRDAARAPARLPDPIGP